MTKLWTFKVKELESEFLPFDKVFKDIDDCIKEVIDFVNSDLDDIITHGQYHEDVESAKEAKITLGHFPQGLDRSYDFHHEYSDTHFTIYYVTLDD